MDNQNDGLENGISPLNMAIVGIYYSLDFWTNPHPLKPNGWNRRIFGSVWMMIFRCSFSGVAFQVNHVSFFGGVVECMYTTPPHNASPFAREKAGNIKGAFISWDDGEKLLR